MASSDNCQGLMVNADITGIGVRVSIYLQAFLLGIHTIVCILKILTLFLQSYLSIDLGRMRPVLCGRLQQRVLV